MLLAPAAGVPGYIQGVASSTSDFRESPLEPEAWDRPSSYSRGLVGGWSSSVPNEASPGSWPNCVASDRTVGILWDNLLPTEACAGGGGGA